MTPDEIELEWPGYLEAHRRPPSFEPTERVMDRAIAALGDIAREAGWFAGRGLTVVVSHSGFIRTVRRCLGAVDQRIPNLGGSWITVTPTGRSTDLTIGELFDPAGITISGVDAPGEDPALPSR